MPESHEWVVVADQLDELLNRAPPRGREAAMIAFGRAGGGLSLASLRKYAAARSYIRGLETSDPDLARALSAASVEAVAVLARWSGHDPSHALKAARRVAIGALSVRGAMDEERNARSAAGAEATTRQALVARVKAARALYWSTTALGVRVLDGDAATREYAASNADDWCKFEETAFSMGGLIEIPSPLARRNRRIDLLAGSGDRQVPILIVSPYTAAKYYAARSPDWLLKAAGVARLQERVGLVLPRLCGPEPFLRWLKQEDPDRKSGIYIIRERLDGGFEAVDVSDGASEGPNADEDFISDEDYEAIASAFE